MKSVNKPNKPTKLLKGPAIALATVGGIAAATAIFATGALSADMLDGGLFEGGLDFGNLMPADGLASMDFDFGGGGDGEGCCGDEECCGDEGCDCEENPCEGCCDCCDDCEFD